MTVTRCEKNFELLSKRKYIFKKHSFVKQERMVKFRGYCVGQIYRTSKI